MKIVHSDYMSGEECYRQFDEKVRLMGPDRAVTDFLAKVAQGEFMGSIRNNTNYVGAQVLAVRKIAELGPDVLITKVWLSALIPTTRDAHAHNDGVPADKNGMWVLNGVTVRWPADISLPPSDRINCLCTINSEFGLTDTDVSGLLEEFSQRILQG